MEGSSRAGQLTVWEGDTGKENVGQGVRSEKRKRESSSYLGVYWVERLPPFFTFSPFLLFSPMRQPPHATRDHTSRPVSWRALLPLRGFAWPIACSL